MDSPKRNSNTFFHRLLLWGSLIFGALLLAMNIGMITNAESEILLTSEKK